MRVLRRALVRTGLSLGLLASSAYAQDPRDEARRLATDGVAKLDAGEFLAARELFHRAYELQPAPSLSVREAIALEKLERLVDAAVLYRATAAYPLDATSPEAYRGAVQEAGERLHALETRIPKLRIVNDGHVPLRVRVDGKLLDAASLGSAIELDPGAHEVELGDESDRTATTRVTLAEADVRTLELHSAKSGSTVEVRSRDDRAKPLRTAGIVLTSIGAAGLLTGVVADLVASSRKSTLDGECAGNVCPPNAQGDLDSFRSARTVSTVGYVAGVGFAAVVLTLFFVGNKQGEPSVAGFVSPDRVGFAGEF